MIFSDEWGKPSHVLGQIAVHPWFCNLICVYQGIQPSLEEFITNYNTSYNFTSPDILQLVQKTSSDYTGDGAPMIETDPDSEIYTQALKSFRSGTATWAAVIYTGAKNPPTYNIEGYYFLSDSEVANIQTDIVDHLGDLNSGVAVNLDRYNSPAGVISIVPVSDMTDNGVIKFRSIEFSDPDESDEDRAIDMSIIISMNNIQE